MAVRSPVGKGLLLPRGFDHTFRERRTGGLPSTWLVVTPPFDAAVCTRSLRGTSWKGPT
jgi:hypothetical protein